jgi:PII-like signaling protein
MAAQALKLSVYIGERDRSGGRLLADALLDVFAQHSVRASVLLRGIEGFGIKHRLLSERTLTLSEDLPMLATALDSPERIGAVLEHVRRISRHGLITLERARLLAQEAGVHDIGAAQDVREARPAGGEEQTLKLTIYLGRHERTAGRPAYLAAVECLHRQGLGGALVQLGLDGTANGVRRRAGMLARNAAVPMTITSVGERGALARALPELAGMLVRPTMTLERVQVCKRDGVLLAEPEPPPGEAEGMAYWQKLVVYAGERSRHAHQPLYSALVRRLRREGAAGATALRGIWGYHGAHQPHGERFWSLARHVPVVVVLLDTPANMRRWFAIVDEVTAETGLVTSELVPALRAAGPQIEHGGLELAAPHGRPSA